MIKTSSFYSKNGVIQVSYWREYELFGYVWGLGDTKTAFLLADDGWWRDSKTGHELSEGVRIALQDSMHLENYLALKK